MSLSQRTFKNGVYGFLNYAWPIAFAIFVTPLIVHRLGTTEYGIFALVNVITGFFAILNFGLLYGLVKELAAFNPAVHDGKRISEVLGATIFIFFVIGVIALAAGMLLGEYGLAWFNIPAESQAAARLVFYCAGAIGFIASLQSVFTHIPYALQRIDIGTKISIVNLILVNVATIGLLYAGYGLVPLAIVQVLSALFSLVAFYYYSKKLLGQIKPMLIWRKSTFVDLFRTGFFFYVYNISATFLAQLDKVILSGMIGPAAVTYYTLPGNVAEKVQGATASFSSILFPVASNLASQGDHQRLAAVYQRSIRMLSLVATGLATSVIVFAPQLLLRWVGAEVAARSTAAMYWLAPTYFILAIFGPISHFLLGLGRAKFLAAVSICATTLNIVMLYAFVPTHGITGAAAAYFLGVTPLLFVMVWAERRFLMIDNRLVFYSRLLKQLFITSLVYVAFWYYPARHFVTGLPTLMIFGTVSVLSFFALFKLFGFFETSEWQLFVSFFAKAFSKLRKSEHVHSEHD
jgi:O-antigen/teichoic acid export membrane protein